MEAWIPDVGSVVPQLERLHLRHLPFSRPELPAWTRTLIGYVQDIRDLLDLRLDFVADITFLRPLVAADVNAATWAALDRFLSNPSSRARVRVRLCSGQLGKSPLWRVRELMT